MQVTETNSEGLKREFTIVVPADDIENRLVDRLNELGRSVRVPGFRPGKVPIRLLKQRYGDSVRGEILEKTIQANIESTMSERGLRPALQPKVEIVSFEEGADLEYKLAVELMPEIEPIDFSKMSLERLVAEVKDSDVEASLGRLAEQRRSFEAVTDGRPAALGDQVLIDFVGRVDGETFEGGAADDFSLELGDSLFIPGFEDQLVGATAGSQVEVKVTFPDDYPAENLKGKEAVFDVAVKEVRGVKTAAVDDELAASMGLAGLDALRSAVREELDREYGQLSRSRLKRALLDRLSEEYEFEVPSGMVDQEFQAIWAQVKEAAEADRLDEDDKGRSEDELRDRYRPIAARRVRLGLLLSEVGRTNNIRVSQDDLNRAMSEHARRFPGQESRIFEFYQRNPQAVQELHAPIFEEKVVDFIVEMANVTDRTVPVEELVRDPDDPAGDG